MSASDAFTIPLMAGGVLVSLFLLLKYLPDGWVNMLLRPYFLVVCGVDSITAT